MARHGHANPPDCVRPAQPRIPQDECELATVLTRKPPLLRSSSATAHRVAPVGTNGRDRDQRPFCGLAGHRARAQPRQAYLPSQAVAGRAARALKGRRPWS
eukprot:4262847-Prymnesium_polylepis.1